MYMSTSGTSRDSNHQQAGDSAIDTHITGNACVMVMRVSMEYAVRVAQGTAYARGRQLSMLTRITGCRHHVLMHEKEERKAPATSTKKRSRKPSKNGVDKSATASALPPHRSQM